MKRLLPLLLVSALPACMSDLDQTAVGAARLPPIDRDYKARIVDWVRHVYPNGRLPAPASISDPVLTRDSTGRLLWLVCLETPAHPGSEPQRTAQRQAFGFAPNYITAPLERRASSLTWESCYDHPLTFRPFAERARR